MILLAVGIIRGSAAIDRYRQDCMGERSVVLCDQQLADSFRCLGPLSLGIAYRGQFHTRYVLDPIVAN